MPFLLWIYVTVQYIWYMPLNIVMRWICYALFTVAIWWDHGRFVALLDYPDIKVHGANMGPIWGRQDPGGPHVGPMNSVIWVYSSGKLHCQWCNPSTDRKKFYTVCVNIILVISKILQNNRKEENDFVTYTQDPKEYLSLWIKMRSSGRSFLRVAWYRRQFWYHEISDKLLEIFFSHRFCTKFLCSPVVPNDILSRVWVLVIIDFPIRTILQMNCNEIIVQI